MFNPNQPPAGGFSTTGGLLGGRSSFPAGWTPGSGSPMGGNFNTGIVPPTGGGMSATVMPQHGFGVLPSQANPMAVAHAFGAGAGGGVSGPGYGPGNMPSQAMGSPNAMALQHAPGMMPPIQGVPMPINGAQMPAQAQGQMPMMPRRNLGFGG